MVITGYRVGVLRWGWVCISWCGWVDEWVLDKWHSMLNSIWPESRLNEFGKNTLQWYLITRLLLVVAYCTMSRILNPLPIVLWRLTLAPGKVVPQFFHQNDQEGCRIDHLDGDRETFLRRWWPPTLVRRGLIKWTWNLILRSPSIIWKFSELNG